MKKYHNFQQEVSIKKKLSDLSLTLTEIFLNLKEREAHSNLINCG